MIKGGERAALGERGTQAASPSQQISQRGIEGAKDCKAWRASLREP